MKVSKFISQTRTSNKQLVDDNIISDRYIYNIGKTVASALIKQETNRRKLLNSDNIFIVVECLDLEEVPYTECNISCDGIVRRSKNKIPQLEEGIYGYTIQGVFNIDNSEEIYPTTVKEFINQSKLRYKSNKLNYIIKNGYIYVMNEDIENINLYIYSVDDSYLLGSCQSMYEANLKIPGYLEKALFDMVKQELINYSKYRQDINDNNLEE